MNLNFVNSIKLFSFTCLISLITLSCGSSGNGGETPTTGTTEPTTPAINPNDDVYELVWSDEFDGSGLPSNSKWTYDLGDGCPDICGWGNQELEFYTNSTENVRQEDGMLIITAKRQNMGGKSFTSARIKTQGKYSFTYGKVQMRARLPEGKGTWPAFWMLGNNITSIGWPACGEVDIMEHVGKSQNVVSNALHNPSSFGDTENSFFGIVPNVASQFHIYEAIWTDQKIDFLVDGVKRYTYNPANKNADTWPYNRPFFIILNVALGGSFGGPVESTFEESAMVVDYVRVYQ